jgi:hypothetical protein
MGQVRKSLRLNILRLASRKAVRYDHASFKKRSQLSLLCLPTLLLPKVPSSPNEGRSEQFFSTTIR